VRVMDTFDENKFDDKMRLRLSRLEDSIPVGLPSPKRPARRPLRLSFGVMFGIAMACLLAGAVAGATVVSSGVRGQPGLFAPGGTFACTQIREMPPQRAGEVLAELGYDVTWQVEDRDSGSTQQTAEAPNQGFIVEGVLHGQQLLLVVEQGKGAQAATSTCQ
jgi:hypothetical protein